MEQNELEAVLRLQSADRRCSNAARVDLGSLFKDGFAVEENATEDVRLFREAADDCFADGIV